MTSPARLHVTAAPRVVDLETLYEVLVLSSAELASELQDWVVDATHKLLERWSEAQEGRPALQEAVPRLWRWLQLKLRAGADDKVELLPLPRPVEFPLRLEHMDFIAGSFGDVKTELQLINGALSGLEEKLGQSQKKLEQLEGQMKRRPTCCSGSTFKTSTDKALSSEKKTSCAQLSRLLNETTALQVERLELPITTDRDVMQTSITETSAALLEEILEGAASSSEAVNGRLSDDQDKAADLFEIRTAGSTGFEIASSVPQHTFGTPKTTKLTHDQNDSSPNELPSLAVFQLYQVLARDPKDIKS